MKYLFKVGTHRDTPLTVWSPPEQRSGCTFPKIPCPFASNFSVKDFPTFLSLEKITPIQLSSNMVKETIMLIFTTDE
jgi:hypothetical protein